MQTLAGAILAWAQPAGAAAPPGGAAAATSAAGGAAAGAPPPAMGCGAGGGWESIAMIVLMFVVFYFLLIRPQQKKAKEHQKMLDALQKGDDVVTSGGIIGKIVGVSDRLMTLEVSEKVRVRVLRSAVAEKFVDSAEKK